LFLDSLDQTLFEFGIVHRQNGLFPVQINLKVRAFAGFEDRSLLREPAPELFARHSPIINNIVYTDNSGRAMLSRQEHAASLEMPCMAAGGAHC
jgi:hypothetical protein